MNKQQKNVTSRLLKHLEIVARMKDVINRCTMNNNCKRNKKFQLKNALQIEAEFILICTINGSFQHQIPQNHDNHGLTPEKNLKI